jgi:bacterioferritin-associated ferredoxin
MIVCVCNRISDREIARHARAGLSFDEIQLELGVATQCGCCEGSARDVVTQCCSAQPMAALRNESVADASQLANSSRKGQACSCSSSSPAA